MTENPLSLGSKKISRTNKKRENKMSEAKKRIPSTVKLAYPIEWDGKIIEEITLQRPRGKHLKKMPSDPGIKDLMALASRVSGQPAIIFDELDGIDVTAICEAIGDFLTSGQ